MQKHRHLHPYLVQSALAAMIASASLSAQACGFTAGAGDMFSLSLDNPLDIMILSVMVGVASAFIPTARKQLAASKRVPG